MKVLLDENLPYKLRTALTGHDVSTVGYMEWNGLKNGELLRTAEDSGIQVFVTADRSLHLEQNLTERTMAIVSLSAQQWTLLREHLAEIQGAIDHATSGSFCLVRCGTFTRPHRSPS